MTVLSMARSDAMDDAHRFAAAEHVLTCMAKLKHGAPRPHFSTNEQEELRTELQPDRNFSPEKSFCPAAAESVTSPLLLPAVERAQIKADVARDGFARVHRPWRC